MVVLMKKYYCISIVETSVYNELDNTCLEIHKMNDNCHAYFYSECVVEYFYIAWIRGSVESGKRMTS